jgi:[ribosomal protein S18]-alanine N-acetyltransferase
MTDIRITPVTPDHVSALVSLHKECFGEAAWDWNQINGSLEQKTTAGWVAYDNEESIGFILCQITPAESDILTICVRPAYQRKGIGEKLTHRAMDEAQHTNGKLFLEVAADNIAAIRLYEKLGFRENGRRAKYYKRGATAVDAILYTLFSAKS